MLKAIINKICLLSLKFGLIPVKVSEDFVLGDKIRRDMKALGLRSKDIGCPLGKSESAISLAIIAPENKFIDLRKKILDFIEQKKAESVLNA